MFTLLFGVDALLNGWITAFFLAILLTIFIGQTHIYQSIIENRQATVQNRFHKFWIRFTSHMLIVAIFGVALGFLLSLEPAQNGGLAPIFNLLQNEFWQVKYRFILDDLEVTVVIMFFLLFVVVSSRLHTSLIKSIDNWGQHHFHTIRIQKLDLVTRAQVATALKHVVRTTRSVLLLLVISGCLFVILSLYSLTSGLSQAIGEMLLGIGNTIWGAIQSFIPNLLMLALISILTRMALKVMDFFYDAIWRGKIRVNTLHNELVEPTYQLLKLLVIAFALVAAFPYIPGSSSPVFKAISIFVGFLLSLGSTSLASNVVSGIVLTYTRGLKVGDRVQIADSVGDVVDRTLLVTRIRTIKNVIISLPNSMMMQNQVVNFSAQAESRGLILHTTVTIGYDVPWRQVDHLLVQAALKTPDILESPSPFVLKTSLDDYYISYELNAYTERAEKMALTYSNLHENILDEFNQGGVEIMSPAYTSLRDGQPSTIPDAENNGNQAWMPGNGLHGPNGSHGSNGSNGAHAPAAAGTHVKTTPTGPRDGRVNISEPETLRPYSPSDD